MNNTAAVGNRDNGRIECFGDEFGNMGLNSLNLSVWVESCTVYAGAIMASMHDML